MANGASTVFTRLWQMVIKFLPAISMNPHTLVASDKFDYRPIGRRVYVILSIDRQGRPTDVARLSRYKTKSIPVTFNSAI